MTTTDANPDLIFADARLMHQAALDRLESGDVRDAAEKAWCAALRATEALVLARTGKPSLRSPDVTRALQSIAAADPSVRTLRDRYFARQASLHGACFYTGWCEPIDDIRLLIHETRDFILDAQALASP